MRGSYTIKGYKRAEAEFTAPRLFHRRGALSVLGGWREATQVGFYGLGKDTSVDARTNYDFQQPYGSATLTLFPTRRLLMLRGGVELSQWSQRPGQGSAPSVETVYSPADPAGPRRHDNLSALRRHRRVRLAHLARLCAARRLLRRHAARLHRPGQQFGFRQIDYEAIQHIPILREAWVISLHGLAQTASSKDDQQIPFFMLPSVGGGSTLRGFSSWRFRDREQSARSRPNGASWSTASSTRPCSTTPARSPRAGPISISTA